LFLGGVCCQRQKLDFPPVSFGNKAGNGHNDMMFKKRGGLTQRRFHIHRQNVFLQNTGSYWAQNSKSGKFQETI